MLATAIETAALLRAGAVSAREVLAEHLQRIEATNPTLNAIVTLTLERAHEMATRADAAFANGLLLGPLHGLPVAHKDLAATAGVRTTLGAPLYADSVPTVDQLQVARQHAAGAVMVGKTNTPELGAGSQTFNTIFGVTRNPHDPTRTCGGSSGGAAVALAAGMVVLADGSDLGGSLRNPAAFCGVVGFRPSPGRVPSWPNTDPWATMSVEGPMARTVADVALYLSVLAGPDPRVAVSLDTPGATFAEPLGREPADVRTLRVAWSPRLGNLPVEPDVLHVLEQSLKRFEALGARVEAADPPLDHRADEVFETLRSVPMATLYGELAGRDPSLFKATIHWNIAEGRRRSAVDVGRANHMRAGIFGKMHEFWTRYDVLACPVTQVLPFPIELEYPTEVEGQEMASYIEWMRVCSRITVTGSPAISVPAGFVGALPVGLQLVAAPRADRFLLQVAHAFEQAR